MIKHPWYPKAGGFVRYQDANQRVFPAVITNVVNQTTVDLRVGNGSTKATVANASKVAQHTVAVGWYRSGR